MLLGLFYFNLSKAQVNCEECSTTPPKEVQIDLCTFDTTVQVNYFNVPNGPFDVHLVDAPLVKVILVYRIQNCPDGTQSLIIDDYVYMDLRQYWEFEFLEQTVSGPTGHMVVTNPVVPTGINCDYDISPEPVSEWQKIMTSAVEEAIERLLDKVGVTSQGNYTVIKKGTCWSQVELEFPIGSYIESEPDDNGNTTIRTFGVGESTVFQFIPCNDNCCKSTYAWEEVEMINGATRWLWKRKSVEGDQGGLCKDQPLPDYNNYPGKMQAKIIDPISGDTSLIFGTIKYQGLCTPSCDLDEPPTTIGFIQQNNNENSEVLLIPNNSSDNLMVKTDKEIKNIVVFSLSGQKVESDVKFENNQLIISSLKNGIYIARIYFSDNSYKTLQFAK